MALSFLCAPTTLGAGKPNIIVILIDDLGNADLGYRSSLIKTPTRAALMTGRYPMRYGLQTLVIFPGHKYGLPTDELTLPQALKQAGYSTAMVGKWHLGHADRKYWPQNRGFDHYYGNLVGEVDYFTKERGGMIDWQRDGKFLKEPGYHTALIGDEAVRIIEARLTAYAREQKTSEWLRAQPSFLGIQWQTAFDPGCDISDGGLPQEKSALPKK